VILSALDINNSLSIDGEDVNHKMGVICNGADAPVTPMEPVEVISPCDTGINRQIILKLPSLEALFLTSDGTKYEKPRIINLITGSYTTKDGYSCTFSVTKTPTSLTISWTGTTLTWGIP